MANREKRGSALSRHKFLLFGITVISLFILGILVVVWPRPTCSKIFQQTAPHLDVDLQIIKNKGTIAIGQQRIQELSDEAQEVGLHLKTCCSVLHAGDIDANQFEQCLDKASAYGQQVGLIAQRVTQAAEAKASGAKTDEQQRAADVHRAIQTAKRDAESIAQQVTRFKSSGSKGAPNKEMGKVTTTSGTFKFERIVDMSMGRGKLTVNQYGADVEIPLNKIEKITFLNRDSIRVTYKDGHSEDTRFSCYWNTRVTFYSGDKHITYDDCAALRAVKEIEFFR